MPSPETLLSARGAPDRLYTVREGNLVVLTMRSGVTETTDIAIPEGWSLAGYEASASGELVAVLMGSGSGMSLGFFDESGEMVGEPRSLTVDPAGTATPGASPAATAIATPVATPRSAEQDGEYQMTWSPESTDVLVTGPSQLIRVPIEGAPESIEIDHDPGSIQEAVWSPHGRQVLLLIAQEDASTRTYLFNLDDLLLREVKALRTTADIRMESLSWLPDGSGLVFVRSDVTHEVGLHGQLFSYRLGQEVPTLVATSGQGGPSASMTQVVPSPDGRSVAYVISIRDGDRWSFHSMWVRSLSDSMSFRVTVDNVASVSQLWWLDSGLAWEQRSHHRNDPGEILFASPQGGPEVILDANGDAQPIATPVATPVGTPHG